MKIFHTISYMLKFVWKHNKKWLWLTAISTVLSAVMPLLSVIFPKYIIDSIFTESDIRGVIFWSITYIGSLIIIKEMIAYIQLYLSICKNQLYLEFQTFIADIVMDMHYKDLENPVTMDLKENAYRNAFSGGQGFCGSLELFFDIVSQAILIVSVGYIIVDVNAFLLLIIIIVILINGFFQHRKQEANYQLDVNKVPYERKLNYATQLLSDFSYGKEIRSYDLKEYLLEKYKKLAGQVNNFYVRVWKNNFKNSTAANITTNMQLLVVYIVLALEAIKKATNYGDFIMQFNAVNTLSSAFSSIMSNITSIGQIGLYINDLEKFSNLPKIDRQTGVCINGNRKNLIEFDHVSFKYPGSQEYALKNINITFYDTDKIAIVGNNGSGKTTFVKLLMRLYDVEEGEIRLNGRNIQEYKYSEYMQYFAAVFQDYKLFAYPIIENIRFGNNKMAADSFERAVKQSGVDEFVGHLPLKYETYLYKIFYDNGIEPSGGQGQKIALARAIYKDAQVIVLDEPTASLDPKSEYEIYHHIHEYTNNRGLIFISHRLASSMFVDTIFVFDKGQLMETGSHDLLMQDVNSLYHEMFSMQASYYAKGE